MKVIERAEISRKGEDCFYRDSVEVSFENIMEGSIKCEVNDVEVFRIIPRVLRRMVDAFQIEAYYDEK